MKTEEVALNFGSVPTFVDETDLSCLEISFMTKRIKDT